MSENLPGQYFDEKRQPLSRTEWIADRLLATFVAMSKPIPAPAVLSCMVEDVCPLRDEQILRGLSRLRKEREWVTVKAIIELAGAAEEDGRPGVETAWAMCPKTEEVSVVWTVEMAEAFGLCRQLLRDGDEIAARMVFKENYPAMVSAARAANVPVQWTPSLGWDQADRVRALSEAIEKKRISSQHAFALLGPERQEELLAALPAPQRQQLTGDVSANPVQLSGFQEIIRLLAGSDALPKLPSAPVYKQTDEERAQHAKRVREQAARVKSGKREVA